MAVPPERGAVRERQAALSSSLVYAALATCEDELESSRIDTTLANTEIPPVGDAFYYEITAEAVSGEESSLAVGTCAERSNFTACP